MSPAPQIPVGVRLPLATDALTPEDLLEICQAALELGYSSFWAGDHILLPESTDSPYPHAADGTPGFRPDTPWADPLLELTWLAAQLPEARFGTSVIILTLRKPALVAKQLSTMSWLTRRLFSLGVGTGWLRDEYEAVGMKFEKRGTRAKQDIAEIKELLSTGERVYPVRSAEEEEPVDKRFLMLPRAQAPVEFLWGGISPFALRTVASTCDGWIPAKQSPENLVGLIGSLREACAKVERDFDELKLVAKPGLGPDPEVGAIDRAGLATYAELGFHEAILELPYELANAEEAKAVLERVAGRTWL